MSSSSFFHSLVQKQLLSTFRFAHLWGSVAVLLLLELNPVLGSNSRVVSHETVASGGTFGTGPVPTPSVEPPMPDEDEAFWREMKAIFGGVLGFWGGVGSLGAVFLIIVLSQRYCCREDDDKDDADG